ncbi:MAG TPA: serine hydrolase domain-containing protein [Humisphaera sp.]|nr:serine hydrolase domain-containing protein [Humisphaera sp.]
MSPTALPRTLQALNDGIARGWHIGAQVFVSLRGQTIANLDIGQSRPGVEMTPDTLMLWLSASKPIGAVAIGQLIERGVLALDSRVADVIPEFGKFGKEQITVRHILTHTCGFRFGETGWPAADWEQIIARVCDIPLERNWVIGQTAGYHPNTSWFIVGEIVRRLDGRPYEQYVRDEIFEPLGMDDCWIGMPAERYVGYGSRMEIVQQMDKGPPRTLPPWDREESFTHCRPAANGCGPAAQLGRFYQMLLNGGELEGVRILGADTVRHFTSRQRVGLFDLSFKHVVDFGFGFIVNSNRYGADTVPYGFGPFASDEAFGHNGFQSTSAFADPRHELVVVIIPNGTPGDLAHEKRLREILSAVYQDLGLAGQ